MWEHLQHDPVLLVLDGSGLGAWVGLPLAAGGDWSGVGAWAGLPLAAGGGWSGVGAWVG